MVQSSLTIALTRAKASLVTEIFPFYNTFTQEVTTVRPRISLLSPALIYWCGLASSTNRNVLTLLTRDSVLEYLGEVTIAPITTTVRDIPPEVFLSTADGMPQDCVVNCDHLQTVAKGKIGSLITSLPHTKMIGVGRAIRFALDI
ncbi:MAG: type II toxin-antitoxin system PemK/MazF family toxin [Desulfobulbaceae bacterium]